MEIEYSMRPEDSQVFARYLASLSELRMGQPKKSLIALGVVVVITSMVGMPLMPIAERVWKFLAFDFGWIYLFGMLVGMLGSFFILFWCVFWVIRSTNRAQFQDPRSNWAYQDIRVIISPSHLRTASRASTCTYDWSVVWHIGLTRSHVFLCLTKNMFIGIPRRAFRDTAHCEEFVELARQYRQDWHEQKQKPTGIITSLPPESTAVTRPDAT